MTWAGVVLASQGGVGAVFCHTLLETLGFVPSRAGRRQLEGLLGCHCPEIVPTEPKILLVYKVILSRVKSVVSVFPWSYREKFLFHEVFVWLWVWSSDGWQSQGQVSLCCLGPELQGSLWADCLGRHCRTRALGWAGRRSWSWGGR